MMTRMTLLMMSWRMVMCRVVILAMHARGSSAMRSRRSCMLSLQDLLSPILVLGLIGPLFLSVNGPASCRLLRRLMFRLCLVLSRLLRDILAPGCLRLSFLLRSIRLLLRHRFRMLLVRVMCRRIIVLLLLVMLSTRRLCLGMRIQARFNMRRSILM